MYDLSKFGLAEMTECAASLRKLGEGAQGTVDVANRTVRYLYENLLHGDPPRKSCALVRFFKTHPYGKLPAELQHFARNSNVPDFPEMPCLVLLATTGDLPEWNQRECSRAHQAIPLASARMIEESPMISQLIRQLGLKVQEVVSPDPDIIMELEQKTFNVFHIPQARGSPYVPAQDDFVIKYGIESVLGFGGMLPKGDLFSVILFSKVPISRETAELVKPLALSVKISLCPFNEELSFS